MKAYKVFNHDWTCRNFKYEVGKTYKHKGEIGLCEYGFHACINAVDCFNYYSFNSENKVAEVELLGEIIHGYDKSVCSEIKIVKEIKWHEVLTLVNTGKGNTGHRNSGHRNSGHMNSGHRNSGHRNSGDRNSGDWNSGHRNSGHMNSGHRNSGDRNSGYRNSGYRNSGDRNSGDRNSGDRNSGDRNSGYRNSGDWNSCDRSNGFFNSKNREIIFVFNKECSLSEWENSQKPNFIYNLNLCEWIWFSDMSDDEKKKYPKAYVCNGYLKEYSYKEAWENAFDKANETEIELLKLLPNFDAEVFFEITGIQL